MRYIKEAFQPDYTNIVDAALCKKSKRISFYEHLANQNIMESVLGRPMYTPSGSRDDDLLEYYTNYCEFWRTLGYDSVSFEVCAASVFPGGGALGGHKPGIIRDMDDFNKYPWDTLADSYTALAFPHFEALEKAMPSGMKAIGGVGNGVFECVQDLMGFMDLCYAKNDDPELYSLIFVKVADVLVQMWDHFLDRFSDLFCIYRFGDDLGYKVSTMLPPEDVSQYVIPQYKRIISGIKRRTGKPFLLHSCGNLVAVMDELISVAGINAKHSNEDVIMPFREIYSRWGGKIGIFGGVDTDVLCDISGVDIRSYCEDIAALAKDKSGIALGCGNSLASYISVDRLYVMNEVFRVMRGE